MTSYTVTIKIEDKILQTLTDDGYSLCIQKFLNSDSGTPTANIIPAAISPGEYSNETSFNWIDEYSIAATSQPYTEGGYLTKTTTDILPISTQNDDSFVMQNWAHYSVKSGSGVAPSNGFAFQPSVQIPDPGAFSVVYLNSLTAGSSALPKAPFYMSPVPSIGGATDTLVPIEQVIVFFFKHAKSGTMITTSRAFPVTIDLTDKTSRTFKLYNTKTWQEVVGA